MNKEILPSLLSFKINEWKKCIDVSLRNNINEFHFDVMEYEYVNNTSFNSDEFNYFLSLNNNIFANIHLMVIDPYKWIDRFCHSQTRCIYFHYEVYKDINISMNLINYIKSKNIQAGIVINPDNKFDEYKSLLFCIDSILVMGVKPGFGGQKLILSTIDNLKMIYEFKLTNNLNYSIEFDGGLNDETIKLVYPYASKFVIGNYYYKNIDNIQNFKKWFDSLK